MDVHYHPHLSHDSKPAKEYFIEFLLIFSAVTLGFFVENYREHIEEKAKAKEYARSLYDDLKVDTALIQRTYMEKVWIIAKYDSAENILASRDLSEYNEFIYYVERYLSQNDVFTTQDITYQQLKSSGNIRYIKNNKLYKKIAFYYNLYAFYKAVDGPFGSINKNELTELESRLFNPRDLTSLDNENATTFYNLIIRPNSDLKPLKRDVYQLKYLYFKIDNAKKRSNESKVFLGRLKGNAIDIMKDLKKEYQLD